MIDLDIEAAMAASLAANHALEKEELANEMLAQLKPIHPSEGNPFRLRQVRGLSEGDLVTANYL